MTDLEISKELAKAIGSTRNHWRVKHGMYRFAITGDREGNVLMFTDIEDRDTAYQAIVDALDGKTR